MKQCLGSRVRNIFVVEWRNCVREHWTTETDLNSLHTSRLIAHVGTGLAFGLHVGLLTKTG
jgi:hypothetical protein